MSGINYFTCLTRIRKCVYTGQITSPALRVDKNVYTPAEYCQEIIECNSSELNGNNQADSKKTELTNCNTGLSWQKTFLINMELLVIAAY